MTDKEAAEVLRGLWVATDFAHEQAALQLGAKALEEREGLSWKEAHVDALEKNWSALVDTARTERAAARAEVERLSARIRELEDK